ncbi:hypothetical protein [Pedobacter nutrimenti]|jgi:hypothetical protein|uniref:DUF4369 domain-containing protein n=1 Tax=Pedobacter nutrimenti TaxID=1241337 RepID=A0A318UIA0_9SPHI|nr:hypothetical protein [Pedobacter nutrimenti]PYF75701.1 hypothetical protein B0O44_102255 [Pedobacter nutrimenti]
MMKSVKLYLLFFFLICFIRPVSAQDAVIIEDGNFVRGTIQGTDFSTVQIRLDDQSVAAYKAKDIKEFLWNGNTYVSKPVVIKKRMEIRFFKAEELGTVNLYSMGEDASAEATEPTRSRVRPAVGLGLGTGGYGSGVGVGGGLSFDLGRRQGNSSRKGSGKAIYYIERPGAGPIQALPLDGGSDAKTSQIKAILLQKLSNDEDLAERINATESFDAKSIKAYVNAYNAMHK